MTEPTRPEKKPRRTGPVPRLLWVAAAFAVLIGIAWIALAVVFPPARVRALVERQLGAALSREVRFEDAKVGLWPPVRLTVKGLALAEPGGFSQGTAIEARSLHLDLSPWGLFARRLTIRRLEIVGVTAHLVLGGDGTTNLDGIGAPAEPGRPSAPMDLAVSSLRVTGGRVLLDDFAASRRVTFALATRMSFALEGGGARVTTAGESRVSDLAFGPLSATQLADLNRSLSRLDWDIAHRAALDLATRRLAVERLALRLGGAEIALAGTVEAAEEPPAVDLQARGSGIDLGQVLAHLSAADARALKGIRGSGRLEFDLGIRGRLSPEDRPSLTGTLAVTEGSFRYPEAPAGVENASFTVRFAPDSILIPDLAARVSGQPVRGSLAAAGFADPRVRFALQGDLDLGAISRLAAPEGTRLSGRAAVDLRGAGRAKDPATLALDGRVRLAKAGIESALLPNPVEQIGGEIEFSTTRAAIRGLSATAAHSSFTFDGSATRPLALLEKPGEAPPAEVDFKLSSPYLDLDELLPPTPGGPMLANARGSGRVSIARLKSKKLDVQNVRAQVRLEPGVLDVSRFDLDGYGGRASGRARFDSRDPQSPEVTLYAQVDSARADALLGTWTGAGKLIRGSVSTTLDLTAKGLTTDEVLKSLSAQGLSAVSNGTLGPAPFLDEIAAVTRIPDFREVRFQDWRMPFRVEQGRVATGPARLVGSHGEWGMAGSVGFDGSLDYAVSITLPPEVVKRLRGETALVAGALADEQGRVLIDLRVGGNAKSPRVSLDQRAMRDRLAGRAARELDKAVKSLDQQLGGTTGELGAVVDSIRAMDKPSRRALEDTLKKAARGLLKGLLGGPKDTTRR